MFVIGDDIVLCRMDGGDRAKVASAARSRRFTEPCYLTVCPCQLLAHIGSAKLALNRSVPCKLYIYFNSI